MMNEDAACEGCSKPCGPGPLCNDCYDAKRRKGTSTVKIITSVDLRRYNDTGRVYVIISWSDGTTTQGSPDNTHMQELVSRALKEGVKVTGYGRSSR